MAVRNTDIVETTPKRSMTKLLTTAGLGAMMILMSACASVQSDNKQALRDAIGASTNTQQDGKGLDPVANAAFWGTRYNREPDNKNVAISFSAALRKIGSHDEALNIMGKTAELNPEDPIVMFEYGKTLIEDSRAFEAIRHLEFAKRKTPDNWQVLSAYGVALDQIGEHNEARKQYNLALQIAPNSVSIMNNKGLSYALSGDLDLAYSILTQATGNLRANSQVRQNLALVSALKGDIKSAERLARSDLPPQVADNNVAYFRNLLSQPAYWQDFAANEITTPSFDEELETDFGVSVDTESLDALPLEPKPEPLDITPEDEEAEDNNDGAPLVLGPVTSPATASFSVNEEVEEIVEVNEEASLENVTPLIGEEETVIAESETDTIEIKIDAEQFGTEEISVGEDFSTQTDLSKDEELASVFDADSVASENLEETSNNTTLDAPTLQEELDALLNEEETSGN